MGKLTKKQKAFIEQYSTTKACNVSATCKSLNVSRKTFYNWKEKNKDFKEMIEEAEESLIDTAETKLLQNIIDGKEASIFFFLKTKGKKRGYVETVENNVNINPFEELMKSVIDE